MNWWTNCNILQKTSFEVLLQSDTNLCKVILVCLRKNVVPDRVRREVYSLHRDISPFHQLGEIRSIKEFKQAWML